MNVYVSEVQELCCHDNDTAQYVHRTSLGHLKVDTVCHGYYVVPKNDINYALAKAIGGEIGKHAIYLEEDAQAYMYITALQDYALMQEIMENPA